MDIEHWAAVFSGVAATVAALLAGANLYLAGRREDLNWKRNALQESVVGFITATYNHRGSVKHIVRTRQGLPSRRPEEEWRLLFRESHEEQLECISRIRLLGSSELVNATLALKEHSETDADLIYADAYDCVEPERDRRQEEFERDRDLFVAQVKRELAVLRGGSILRRLSRRRPLL